MARHHKSMKRHLSHHDKEVDRENLMHGRHHKQSEHSRYKEHAGEERHLHGYHHGHGHVNTMKERGSEMAHMAGYHERELNESGSYSGYKESRRMMGRDSVMIHEDRNAACLLPTHVIEREWPMPGQYVDKGIGSLFSGVQETMREDRESFNRENKPKQY